MADSRFQFKVIRKIVNNWDPCGLISSGAPEDEYDSLAYKLLSGYVNKLDKDEQKEEIIQLLDKYYGGPSLHELSTENQIKLVQNIDQVINEIKNNANMH
jgi:hypothetical protein